ncbi:lysosomal alpha-glucosidase-like isoform X2 [Belonocnema kinseyi]|uniref:lysosomal alpha-glucosidase-like isoform X2 n=1 Tax=Belonocnema kinseyi TaxID=2817044 RepID=UPI00143D0CEC|nr:lysosomal alpha-glucosidase-like isoform X2 [Belonocnema kinseyi]
MTILKKIFLWMLLSSEDTCWDHIINKREQTEDLKIKNHNIKDSSCSLIPENQRFDCNPEDGASELACGARNCCWQFSEKINIPSCYYRLEWKVYDYENLTTLENGIDFSGFLKLNGYSTYYEDLPLVKIESTSIDDSTLRVKLYDPLKKRYEPPWPVRSEPKSFSGTTSYVLKINKSIPGFSVKRVSDGTTLYNSSGVGGFIFANQFLQMSALLPSHNIYGLGQHRANLKLSTNWKIFTFFNADQPVTENANLYGAQPFYFVIENTGKCHGVLFLNSNAMDVILQPTPAITFRTIGGVFDIYFFMGPTPADVMKQYSNFVGKPFLLPYWSLGFHLSRLGYRTLEETKEVWNRTRMAQIPFEGMHYIPLIDAGVSGTEKSGSYPPLDEGIRRGIFIKENGTDIPFQGKVWNPISTVWPDFTNPETEEYYKEMMEMAHKNFEFDGAWIDMNEPSNFYNGHINGCVENNLDNPQFVPHVVGRHLSRKTLCMNSKQFLGDHYDLHNTYGTGQAAATNYALAKIRRKRPFIISRSTWIGHGLYAGAWTGDAYSSWHSLRFSIPEILTYSFFQIPMVGVDICGFDGNVTIALCNRWVQVGAFYPFARNHNSDDTTEQDPVKMGELVVNSTRISLRIRYSLLPYLYTLFFRAHKFGETVARPLFFEFINDSTTHDIDSQFLWGSSLMIIPVLDEVADKNERVQAYIPRGKWYNFHTKEPIISCGKNMTLTAPIDTIPLLIRGGFILPMQKADLTTTASRKNHFELLIALNEENRAEGELYWDDGDSLDSIQERQFRWLKFTVENNTLQNKLIEDGLYDGKMTLGKIQIVGLEMKTVPRIMVNDNDIRKDQIIFNKELSYLRVESLYLNLKQNFTLSWMDS